jgi:hypothetical protein
MTFEIEDNVPAPDGSQTKYPWAQMESGQSIKVPIEEGKSAEDMSRALYNNARDWLGRNRPGWKPRTRREGNFIRVWLIGTKKVVSDDAEA